MFLKVLVILGIPGWLWCIWDLWHTPDKLDLFTASAGVILAILFCTDSAFRRQT